MGKFLSLLLFLVFVLTGTASTFTGTVSDCNGHGWLSGRPESPSHCDCEQPYTGEECELCRDGYYGDPRNGGLCFLSCQQSKHLTRFTTAGVGVTNEFLLRNPPDQRGNLCVWVIDPQSQTNPEQYSSTQSVSNFTISLHFNSSPLNSFSENLLIYQQLPSFLNFATPRAYFNFSSSFISHFYHHSNKPLPLDHRHNLLYSLTRDQLRGSSLTLHHDVLTLVYLYSGNRLGDSETAGFNVSIRVGDTITSQNVSNQDDVITRDSPHPRPTLLLSSLSELLSNTSEQLNCESTNQITDNGTVSILNETTSLDCPSPLCPPPVRDVEVCRGRYWHSSVYDEHTGSLWLFGGVDVRGDVCEGVLVVNVSRVVAMKTESCEGCVRRVGVDGCHLTGRYLHTAVLSRCPNDTLGNSSCMVVYGGFPSNASLSMPSNELWLYQGQTETWTRLPDAPGGVGVAAHSSVMVRDNVMMVVGGVRSGQVSSLVLTYSVDVGVWDVWGCGAVPGLYGHSAVYDNTTNSVYLYGGVVYSHPTADISSSLYVLNVETRSWAEVVLATETAGRVFHSMLLFNHTLFVIGGVVKANPSPLAPNFPGLDSLVHTPTTLLIDVGVRCDSGRTVLVSDWNLTVWGHFAVWNGDGEIYLSGGFDKTALDSVWSLTVPGEISCFLAQTLDQCQALPACVSCVNSTRFIGCLRDDERWLCNDTGTEIVLAVSSCSKGRDETCSQFVTCEECLRGDVAQSAGCVWCGCSSGAKCVGVASNCSCDRVASNLDDIGSVCPLDKCRAPSCQECIDDPRCGWTFIQVTPNLEQTQVVFSSGAMEWSCLGNFVNERVNRQNENFLQTTVTVCPAPCESATSCGECVGALSANGGPLHCVWAVHTHTCMSHDLAPLTCTDGLCGGFVTNGNQCPPPCSAHSDCDSCLADHQCSFYLAATNGQLIGVCTDASNSYDAVETILDRAHSEIIALDHFYDSCSVCSRNCSGRGLCVFSDLRCECDVGYVGGDCSVECECGGLSGCANETAEGRRECLHCQQNTQGPNCGQCQPFFVGNPGNGVGCISCRDYCHGNSEVCIRRTELEEALQRNVSLSQAQLLVELVESGPGVSEAVCVECGGFSTGDTCNTCLRGYYRDENAGQSSFVQCTECLCNGHGDCDVDSGVCECEDNTRSVLCEGAHCSLDLQCNLCLEGFIGAPSDSNQCYRELSIDQLNNVTISPNQSLPLAIGLDYQLSNVNVQVHFIIIYGELTIYDALNNRAVSVSIDPETLGHVITIRPGFTLTRLARDAADKDVTEDSQTFSVSKRQGTQSSTASQSVFVHQVRGSHYVLIIPTSEMSFQMEQHYLTIVAGSVGARFFVYYQQVSSGLNYFVFASGLISSFLLTFAVSLLIWKAIKLEMNRRSRVRERELQSARTRRPFAKVYVFFDRKNVRDSKEKASNPIFFLKPPLEDSAIIASPSQPPTDSKEQRLKLQPTQKKSKKSARKHKYRIDPIHLSSWPVAQQPLRDEWVSVGTVLVKLPTRNKGSGSHVICAGSCLTTLPKEEEKKKWKMRNNRCAPAAESGGLEIELSTQL